MKKCRRCTKPATLHITEIRNGVVHDGRGGPGRWVLGSVADRVLRGATLPVLLVRVGMPTAEARASTAPTTAAD